MVLFEKTQNTVNWEERAPQKEEKNLIVNLNLDGKEKQGKKNQTTNPKESPSPSPELHNCGSDVDMGSLLCLEPPRIPPKLWSCTSAFSSTSIHSRINLPVTFSIKLGNCAEGQILTICSRMRQAPLQSPQAGIQSRHHWGQGVSAWKLLWRVKMSTLNGKIRTEDQEKRWDQRKSAQNKRKEGHTQIYF